MTARLLRDPLGYLEQHGYGSDHGVVSFRILGKRCFLVTDPECIEQALHTPIPPLARGPTTGLKRWFTTSVFIEAGSGHDREREFWKALFSDAVPAAFTSAAVTYTRTAADRLEEGVPIDVYTEMKSIRRAVDWHVLTGGNLEQDAPELAALLDIGFAAQTVLITPLGAAYWYASRRLRAAKRAVD